MNYLWEVEYIVAGKTTSTFVETTEYSEEEAENRVRELVKDKFYKDIDVLEINFLTEVMRS